MLNITSGNPAVYKFKMLNNSLLIHISIASGKKQYYIHVLPAGKYSLGSILSHTQNLWNSSAMFALK